MSRGRFGQYLLRLPRDARTHTIFQDVPLYITAHSDSLNRHRTHTKHQAQQTIGEHHLLARLVRRFPPPLRRLLRVLSKGWSTHATWFLSFSTEWFTQHIDHKYDEFTTWAAYASRFDDTHRIAHTTHHSTLGVRIVIPYLYEIYTLLSHSICTVMSVTLNISRTCYLAPEYFLWHGVSGDL